jgi:glycosyltransferase 2 family protein
VLYRDSGPSLAVTRLQQVEHEAFLTFRAAQAGVTVPEVVEAGTAGPSGDSLLVVRPPAGSALADTDPATVSDAALADPYRQLLSLRHARIAHGAISAETVLVDAPAQTMLLTDFRNGVASASAAELDRDLAGALAATAVAVGAERAAASAARSLRAQPKLLEEVRQQAAQAASIDQPELVQPRGVSWATLIMVAGSLTG